MLANHDCICEGTVPLAGCLVHVSANWQSAGSWAHMVMSGMATTLISRMNCHAKDAWP